MCIENEAKSEGGLETVVAAEGKDQGSGGGGIGIKDVKDGRCNGGAK